MTFPVDPRPEPSGKEKLIWIVIFLILFLMMIIHA